MSANPNYIGLSKEDKEREIQRIRNSCNFWKQAQNQRMEEFDFDRDTFEDLIECYTPIDDIPVLLGVSKSDLDFFCKYIYNQDYKTAYGALLMKSNAHNRKAFNSLSKKGNQTAMKIVAEQFMGLGKIDNNEAPIQFICNVPAVKSDVENLSDSDTDSDSDSNSNSDD